MDSSQVEVQDTLVVTGSIIFNEASSADSSAIIIRDGVRVTGTVQINKIHCLRTIAAEYPMLKVIT